VTLAHDRHLQTGIAGSVAIHAVLLLLMAWGLNTKTAHDFLRQEEAQKEKEPEVTLIYPEQVILQPPPEVEKKPQAFIRTTQNEEATVKPQNAAFQSDKNTTAASMKPAVAGSTIPMPTLDGTAPDIRELANRDFKDGELKNDSAPTTSATPAPPKAPPSILKPQQTPPPAPPPQMAAAQPAPTPLKKMMQEMDDKTAVLDKNRLPLEVRKADTPSTPDNPPPAPPTPPVAMAPQVRIPEDTPPPIVKAVPVEEDAPMMRNTPNPEKDAFSPFTRTSKTDGSISREGMDAVDAEATPLGIYMRKVTGAVEKKWHLYVRLGKDSVTFGRVRFRFYVDRKGTPQDLKILSDARDADPRMRELTLRAILDAQIPPIPADLLPTLDDGRVKIEYEAIIY